MEKGKLHSFKTWPGGLTWDPADPGLKPGWVEEKTKKEKTRCEPADRARLGQKLGCNPLTFVFFFTKTTSF
jgi:hypothetical protein